MQTTGLFIGVIILIVLIISHLMYRIGYKDGANDACLRTALFQYMADPDLAAQLADKVMQKIKTDSIKEEA